MHYNAAYYNKNVLLKLLYKYEMYHPFVTVILVK